MPDDAVIRWTADGKSLLVASLWWEVPLRVEKLDLATGRREPFTTLGPAELTGAVQIAPIAFTDDGKSHAYAVGGWRRICFWWGGAR